MSRIIKMPAGCAVVVAFAAVGVSSASAAFTLTTTKCEGTGVATLCWAATAEGKELFELSGSEAMAVTGGASDFREPILGVEILSTSFVGVGMEAIQKEPLTAAYKLKGRLEFLGVKFDVPEHCTLETGETLLTEALVGFPNKTGTEVTFEPETGPTGSLFTWTVRDDGTGKCPATIIGTNKLKGTQTCSIPSSAVDLVKHKIECKTTGSKLKYAGDEATFEGTGENELASKDPWSGREA